MMAVAFGVPSAQRLRWGLVHRTSALVCVLRGKSQARSGGSRFELREKLGCDAVSTKAMGKRGQPIIPLVDHGQGLPLGRGCDLGQGDSHKLRHFQKRLTAEGCLWITFPAARGISPQSGNGDRGGTS